MRHFLATEPAPTHEHGGSLRGDAAPAPKRARTQPPAATPETTSAAATPVAKAGSGTTAAASATAADASGATADVSTPAAAGSAPPTVAEGEAAVSEAPSPAPVQTVLPWQLNEKDVLAWLKVCVWGEEGRGKGRVWAWLASVVFSKRRCGHLARSFFTSDISLTDFLLRVCGERGMCAMCALCLYICVLLFLCLTFPHPCPFFPSLLFFSPPPSQSQPSDFNSPHLLSLSPLASLCSTVSL